MASWLNGNHVMVGQQALKWFIFGKWWIFIFYGSRHHKNSPLKEHSTRLSCSDPLRCHRLNHEITIQTFPWLLFYLFYTWRADCCLGYHNWSVFRTSLVALKMRLKDRNGMLIFVNSILLPVNATLKSSEKIMIWLFFFIEECSSACSTLYSVWNHDNFIDTINYMGRSKFEERIR